MTGKRKGEPLKKRDVRLSDDVWDFVKGLGRTHGTIDAGLRTLIVRSVEVRPSPPAVAPIAEGREARLDVPGTVQKKSVPLQDWRQNRQPLSKPSSR
jgi:hypothetical protein